MTRHCYSRSISSILILILNIRKTLRMTNPSLSSGEIEKIEEQYIIKRKVSLTKIAQLCINSCDQPALLEYHFNSYGILIDSIENYDSIVNGQDVISDVLFRSSVLDELSGIFIQEDKTNFRQLPELIHHICQFAKKIGSDCDSSLEIIRYTHQVRSSHKLHRIRAEKIDRRQPDARRERIDYLRGED